jgi:hypothetical protein
MLVLTLFDRPADTRQDEAREHEVEQRKADRQPEELGGEIGRVKGREGGFRSVVRAFELWNPAPSRAVSLEGQALK